jgi:hypothetical protein
MAVRVVRVLARPGASCAFPGPPAGIYWPSRWPSRHRYRGADRDAGHNRSVPISCAAIEDDLASECPQLVEGDMLALNR